MEETIGYEALFSPEQWDWIIAGEPSGPTDWGSPNEEVSETKHSVFVATPPGQYEGNGERFELECDICDYIGAADSMEEAVAIAKLHETFVATLVEKWSVEE
ncbi:MAG: hypothetical protein M3198_14340 [Actinomycetota bacterium]|nr:hypothetical protein [Actinomycetota bacterium]